MSHLIWRLSSAPLVSPLRAEISILPKTGRFYFAWTGGISLHGSLIGTTIAGLIYLRHRKIPLFPAVDACFLAAQATDEAAALAPFRRVRDKIKAFVEGMPANLE